MKYVCDKTCQVRANGRIITLRKGETLTTEDKIENPNLRTITAKVDFGKASENELFEADFDLNSLKQYIKDAFDIPVRVRSKKSLIELLMDCRFRFLDEPPSSVEDEDDGLFKD